MPRPNSPVPPPGRLTMGLFHTKKVYSRWREHGAPGWLLIRTEAGMGRFGHEGGELVVRTQDLILLPPNVRNDYGLEDSMRMWDLMWAYFFPRPDWLPLLNWPEAAPGIRHLFLSDLTTHADISVAMTEALFLHNGPRRQREMLAMNALEKMLLLCDAVNPRSEQSGIDARILKAMDYLCRNLAEPVTLEKLARKCGLSVSRLAHLFRAQVGQTPHQFLEMQRMTRARQLLDLTQQPISAVAAESGFPDLYHFSKRFKRHAGVSPRHYRARHVAGAEEGWR